MNFAVVTKSDQYLVVYCMKILISVHVKCLNYEIMKIMY